MSRILFGAPLEAQHMERRNPQANLPPYHLAGTYCNAANCCAHICACGENTLVVVSCAWCWCFESGEDTESGNKTFFKAKGLDCCGDYVPKLEFTKIGVFPNGRGNISYKAQCNPVLATLCYCPFHPFIDCPLQMESCACPPCKSVASLSSQNQSQNQMEETLWIIGRLPNFAASLRLAFCNAQRNFWNDVLKHIAYNFFWTSCEYRTKLCHEFRL